jgi:putative DNA primase/helicase
VNKRVSDKKKAARGGPPVNGTEALSIISIIPENSMECLKLVARMFAGEVVFLRLKGYSAANKENVAEKRYSAAKMPIDKEWTSHNFDRHSFDALAKWVDEADGWIGMRVPDDYIVVDVDNASEGREIAYLLQRINIAHHLLKTPNGYQFIFKDSGSVEKQNVKMFTECGFEVDYRLQNRGQIVIPTPNTEGRSWLTIAESDVAEMPHWFTPVKQVNQKNERPFIVPISEGARNTTLYQHACRLKKMARSEMQILHAIGFIGTYLCTPSIEENEIETIVSSAMKHNDDVIDLSKRRNNVVRHPAVADMEDEAMHGDRPWFRNTDLGNANRLIHYFGHDLRFCKKFGSWYIWNGKRWDKDDTGEIERKAIDAVLNIYKEALEEEDEKRVALMKHGTASESRQKISNMVSLAQNLKEVIVTPDELDADHWKLNCENGVIDLKTGKLLQHDRKNLMTRVITANYDPNAECPVWETFIDRIMQDDKGNVRIDLVEFLQKAVGYALTGDISEQVMFVLHGAGRNGKSTFINTIKDLLGDYARQASTETFVTKQNTGNANTDIARLKGSRLVSAVESEQGKRLAESLVKQLTGGEPITARFLYQDEFEFKPSFKIFFTTNHKPEIRGTDKGIWRRIKLIPFTVTIPTEEVDTKLDEKLKKELPGILRWAVEGCLKWQRQGLEEPKEVREATEGYREEMDVLLHFVKDCCVINPRTKVASKNLYQEYTKWCEDNGEYAIKQRKFIEQLKEGYPIQEARMPDKSGSRGWQGIGLMRETDITDGKNGSMFFEREKPIEGAITNQQGNRVVAVGAGMEEGEL